MDTDRHRWGKVSRVGAKLLLVVLLAGVVFRVMTPKAVAGRVPTLDLVHYHQKTGTNGLITTASLRLKNNTGRPITMLGNAKRVSAFLGQMGKDQRFMIQSPRNVVLQAGEEYVFDVSVWDASTTWVASVEYVEGSHSGVRNGLARILPVSLERRIWEREISQKALTVAAIPAAN